MGEALEDQQLLPAFLHTFLNLTQHQDMEKEASVEEIVGGDGSQPDTASLVILLVGSLVLFLFYLGLKYYTTDSFRCTCRKTEEREVPPWERRPSSPVLGMAAVVARMQRKTVELPPSYEEPPSYTSAVALSQPPSYFLPPMSPCLSYNIPTTSPEDSPTLAFKDPATSPHASVSTLPPD